MTPDVDPLTLHLTPTMPAKKTARQKPITADAAFRYDRAQRGGLAKAETRARAMHDAAAELHPLQTPDDALIRLEQIGRLAVAGTIPGTAAMAATNSVKAWLDAHRDTHTRQLVRELQARIRELERDLAAARRGATR